MTVDSRVFEGGYSECCFGRFHVFGAHFRIFGARFRIFGARFRVFEARFRIFGCYCCECSGCCCAEDFRCGRGPLCVRGSLLAERACGSLGLGGGLPAMICSGS